MLSLNCYGKKFYIDEELAGYISSNGDFFHIEGYKFGSLSLDGDIYINGEYFGYINEKREIISNNEIIGHINEYNDIILSYSALAKNQ